MYKIIDLGCEFEATGERRVTLLNTKLTKVASSEIQNFWDSIERKPGHAYLWVIGVSAMEYYGCNNNGDSFTGADLKKQHSTFVTDANVFLHHVNKDPERSIGKPIYSYYNDKMHRVEIIMEINKNAAGAGEVLTKLEQGDPIYVSMGCHVQYDVCSICGNKAKHRGEYCDHLRYNLKKILPDGRQVYALNPNPRFFDISIVRKPADPTAFTLDKAASVRGDNPVVSSAELGEQAVSSMEKYVALEKLSELTKRIDGDIVAVQDDSTKTDILRQVYEQGFADLDYPAFDHEELVKNNIGPRTLFMSLLNEGSPILFGDALYAAGHSVFGPEMKRESLSYIFNALPLALKIIRNDIGIIDTLIRKAFAHEEPKVSKKIIVRVIRPVAHGRIKLASMAFPEPGQELRKNEVIPPDYYNRIVSHLTNTTPGNLREVNYVDNAGNLYVANYGDIRNTKLLNLPYDYFRKILGGALIFGAISSILNYPLNPVVVGAGSILGLTGLRVISNPSKTNIQVNEGFEVPASTFFSKKASSSFTDNIKSMKGAFNNTRTPMGSLVGMAIPAVLGLDYAFNKWRYGPNMPYIEEDSMAARLGKVVHNNPVTSISVGGFTGAIIENALKKKFG